MAKQTNRPNIQARPVAKSVQAQEEPAAPVRDPAIPEWLYSFKVQAFVVALLAIIFYINTSKNEYALDDTIVIVKNEYVHQGFAGLPDIFGKDAFDSYYKQFNSSNQLSGGRYRPLSIATFAIEQQFFGAISKTAVDSFIVYGMTYEMKTVAEKKFLTQMHIRHFINVLLYALLAVVLLYFLRYIVFKNNHIMAFLAVILFTIHPLHTEVVANVKSRDEIMSLLFICSTFIMAFKYHEYGKTWMLVAGVSCYLLAFLSKEYAITIVVLLPLSLYLFNKFSLSKSIMAILPYLIAVGIYGLLRRSVTGDANPASDADILNNPYAFAGDTEKLATKLATSLNYMRLLIFPHPLSSDYSYNTIPYKDFSNPLVWLAMVVYGGCTWIMFSLFGKFNTGEREVKILGVKINNGGAVNTTAILCFAIAFFMAHFMLVCNLIFNIGATMGERLIFHSSVGFCIVVAFLLYKGMEKIKPAATGRMLLAGLMLGLIVICGFTTIERNTYWKNDQTLFDEDIKRSPNSVLVNANVASSLINKSDAEKDTVKKFDDLRRGIAYYDKTVAIHPTFVSGYMNRGVAYMKLNLPDSAKANYDRVASLYPNYPKLYEIYYNLGVCYYMNKMVPQAVNIWRAVLNMKPDQGIALTAQQSINTAIQAMNAGQQPPAAAPQQARPQQAAPPPAK